MRRRFYEWDPRPPTTPERVIAGVLLAAILLIEASIWTGWRLLGGYERHAEIVIVVIGLVLVTKVFPGVRRA
jgi:hypothetical protein